MCRYAFNQKKAVVEEVKHTEEEWRKMTAAQRKRFNDRAKSNHEANDATKEHMRQARADLVDKKHGLVKDERKAKLDKATELVKSRSQQLNAKRLMRDALYSQRFVSPEKKRLVQKVSSRAALPPNPPARRRPWPLP